VGVPIALLWAMSSSERDTKAPETAEHRAPWHLPEKIARPLPLNEDVSADVCVIGAGMAGLLCALELAERGHSVVVVDRSGLGSGDTGATSAHLTAVLDNRYFELEKMHGEDAARLIAASHMRGIAHLERVANKYGIECDFRRVSGFLCAASDDQEKQLVIEHSAASRAGLHCQLVRRSPLALTTGPALHVPRQAQFDPLAFLAGVARALREKAVRIYAPATVVELDSHSSKETTLLTTTEGASIRARHVVVATHTPVNDVAALHTKQAPYRSYVIALESESGSGHPHLAWDMEDPYHYARYGRDSKTQREVLIVGGNDHRVGQGSDSQANLGTLEAWARERFPSAGRLVCQWSGQVFEPSDGLAFIGKNPGDDHVFILTGFSGNGMTYSGLGAELIADLIEGESHPYAELYTPSRKPASTSAISDFIKENWNTAAQYADWVAPADVSKLEEIPRGEGAVMRRGLRRVAVYVDEAGRAHELSATCPHLAGVVSWNSAEKSWDCPCHGSRFDCHGKVITGPAVSDLEPAPRSNT
jgi:glycine/D-amino acid oxidase-like deaminating enzyme/nitrite reductase/ring-hydroxylating ferredoxin subunit